MKRKGEINMNKELSIDELLQCLEAVSTYEKGEGTEIIEYDNEFLLSNEDIKNILNYIKKLKENNTLFYDGKEM